MKDIVSNGETTEADGISRFHADDSEFNTFACPSGGSERKYMDGIELSNVCRQFYQSRKQAAADVKERLANSGRQKATTTTTKLPSKIELAMETLRNEMASLMEQDLSLMKQLLTLNETIEDLKWQKKFSNNQSSLPSSSCDLSMPSDWSESFDTEMYEGSRKSARKLIGSISLDCTRDPTKSMDIPRDRKDLIQRSCSENKTRISDFDLQFDLDIDTDCQSTETGAARSSFDSGIHENLANESFA